MSQQDLLRYLKRMQAMAKVGLSYAKDPYDLERYEEIRDSTNQLLSQLGQEPLINVERLFQDLDDDYPTPKVDVRAVVVRDGHILLVQEKTDQQWALPGGWCDLGLSPAENVVKEVREEAGLRVKATRVLAVWDKAKQDHPPDLRSIYKIVFHCEELSETGASPVAGHEVAAAAFFADDALPDLSLTRNTPSQIQRLMKLIATEADTDYDR